MQDKHNHCDATVWHRYEAKRMHALIKSKTLKEGMIIAFVPLKCNGMQKGVVRMCDVTAGKSLDFIVNEKDLVCACA